MRREVGRSDEGVFTLELVGCFTNQLFYGERAPLDDDAPLADLAGSDGLSGADDRVVVEGLKTRMCHLRIIYYYPYNYYYFALGRQRSTVTVRKRLELCGL